MMGNKAFISDIAFSLLLILFLPQASAAAYKWVDENGETHFGGRVPEQYREDRKQVRAWSDTARRHDRRAVE